MTEQLHDATAERAVLSVMLRSKIARQEIRKHLVSADLYEPAHELIWDAIGRLDRAGKSVDPMTVLPLVRPDARAVQILPDLVTLPVATESAGDYAEQVRDWATRRRIVQAATNARQQAMQPDLNPTGYAASLVNTFAGIRDFGAATDETTALTLTELLAMPEEPYDWAIPDLLERGDRLILTGEEGMGKVRCCGRSSSSPQPEFILSRLTAASNPSRRSSTTPRTHDANSCGRPPRCTPTPAGRAATPARTSCSMRWGGSTSPENGTLPASTPCATRCNPTCWSSARCTGCTPARSTATTRRHPCSPRWTHSRIEGSLC